MNSFVMTLVFIGLLIGLLVLTNPSAETHKHHIYLAFKTQLFARQEQLQRTLATDKQWATFFEMQFIKLLSREDVIKLFIRTKLLKAIYQNNSLFSTITLQSLQGKQVFVSLGIFGHVFVNHRWYHQNHEFPILKFLTHLTPPLLIIMCILFVMSIATWYLIIVKTLHFGFLRWQISRSAKRFWRVGTVNERRTNPFNDLAWHGVQASLHHKKQEITCATTICSHSEFITRALRYALAKNKIQLESGLTFLAVVASTAPFIGLLGTVIGIYSALMAISMQKNVTIEIIAAPVGEALIMTAIGLAVAIPAVFAYNFFVRWQRRLLLQLESAAHELHTFLNTGARY